MTHIVLIEMENLTCKELEQALVNTGYNITHTDYFRGGGIERILSKEFVPDEEMWKYLVRFKDDGSFDEDDNRYGALYVSYDYQQLRVVADF